MSIYQKKIEYIASYQKTIDNIKNNISTPIITHNYPDYPDIKPNLNEYIFIDKPYHLEIIKKKEFDRIDKNRKILKNLNKLFYINKLLQKKEITKDIKNKKILNDKLKQKKITKDIKNNKKLNDKLKQKEIINDINNMKILNIKLKERIEKKRNHINNMKILSLKLKERIEKKRNKYFNKKPNILKPIEKNIKNTFNILHLFL